MAEKRQKNEKWWYKGKIIEVVKEYKYLGILLNSTLNLGQHFKSKKENAKRIISNFDSIILKNEVPAKSKLHIFDAVIRSSISYGAQVWGCKMYSDVEVLQKYFLKRIFCLPRHTPDYVLYLETCLFPLFVYTLELHLWYKNRCLELDHDRYPRFFIQEIIKRKVFWYTDWTLLAREFKIPINEITKAGSNVQELVSIVKSKLRESYLDKLSNSRTRLLYKEIQLNDELEKNYLYQTGLKTSEIVWIFKARGELIYLNKYSFNTESKQCSLCNLMEEEDTFHFIAKCPILSPFRRLYFKKGKLDKLEFLNLFKKENLRKLALYCKYAWNYRYDLVQEFNY